MTRLGRFALAWCAAAWVAGFGVGAHGQTAPSRAPAPSAAAPEQAQLLFEQGVRSFESGGFEIALGHFRQSLELFPTPAAYKNAALCLRELGRFDEALDLLETLPRRFPDLPSDEMRKNALKIDELSSQVGWVELRGVQSSSQLVVDDRERGAVPLDSRVRLSSGLHRVRVMKEGMAPTEVSVAAVSGQTIVAEIDQRPSVAPYPSSWILGVELGGAFTSTLGGDVAGCPSPCDRGMGGGGRAIAHVEHALGSKLFLSLDAGYLQVNQNVDQRPDAITVVGGDVDQGHSQDDLSLRGALAGVSLGYRLPSLGDSFVRAGVGSFLGWVRDERHGDFNTAGTPVTNYPAQQIQLQPAYYGYLSAALGVGFRPSSHFRLGAGLDAIAMVALRQPKWDGTCPECSISGRDGEGQFANSPLAGRFIMLVSPFVEAGYAF